MIALASENGLLRTLRPPTQVDYPCNQLPGLQGPVRLVDGWPVALEGYRMYHCVHIRYT